MKNNERSLHPFYAPGHVSSPQKRKLHDEHLAMMRCVELKRRGLRFMPIQAVKRALRLYMAVLSRQDPPEYLVPLGCWGLRAGNHDAEKNTKSPLG